MFCVLPEESFLVFCVLPEEGSLVLCVLPEEGSLVFCVLPEEGCLSGYQNTVTFAVQLAFNPLTAVQSNFNHYGSMTFTASHTFTVIVAIVTGFLPCLHCHCELSGVGVFFFCGTEMC